MLPPGGEGEIKVTLTPKPNQLIISKTIGVETNDPVQPRFELTVKAELLTDMIAEPMSVSMREVKVGDSATATLTLRPTPESTAKVTEVTIEDTANFTLRKLESREDGSEVYEVGFRGRDTAGRDSTQLLVKTTGENTPELRVPVNVNSVLNLRFAEKIRFSHKQGVLQERVIRITAREGDAPKIKKVEDPDGMLDIEVLEPQQAMASIRLTVKTEKLEGLDNQTRTAARKLIVHTNDRDQPKIEIEYRIAPDPSAKIPQPKMPVGTIPAEERR